MRIIKVYVKKDGKVVFDFEGYKGKLCMEEAERLKKVLAEKYGLSIENIEIRYKPEYYQVVEGEQKEEVAWGD